MRYLPLTDQDRREMLTRIGVTSVDALYPDQSKTMSVGLAAFSLPDHQSELEVERHMDHLAKMNSPVTKLPTFLGGGAYHHHVPATVDALIQRGEFLTSYTPYQPEVSQGTLQYLFEFQTMVTRITGMEIANASMYDGATACAEAVLMAHRVTKRKKAILSGGVHPHYREVTQTYTQYTDYTNVMLEADPQHSESLLEHIDEETSCVVVGYPTFFGHLQDYSKLAEACHAKGALLVVVVTEFVSLGLLTPPGSMGADIVVAEGQSIGNALNFGGPYLGLFATRKEFVRQMPGRICGETVDVDGKRGYVLTLSAREQHIRREKATSNICTNAGLCSLAFTIHLALLGEEGFRRLATLNHAKAMELKEKLKGVEILNTSFFNEITLKLPKPADQVVEICLDQSGVIAGIPVSRFLKGQDDLLLVAVTEMNSSSDIDRLAKALEEACRG